MDAATARATLVSYLGGPSARPALEADEIDAILSRFRLADTDGRRPSDEGWLPTYALNAAAAEGYRIKAARVAADFNFSADGASFSKGDVMAKLLEMEQHYASLDHGSLYLDDGPADYKAVNLWL